MKKNYESSINFENYKKMKENYKKFNQKLI